MTILGYPNQILNVYCVKHLLLLGFLWLWSQEAVAQQPAGVVEVSGRVLNKSTAGNTSLDNINLFVVDYGTIPLQEGGYFQFKAPKGLDLKIEVIPTSFRILRPLDGVLDGQINDFRIEIYVMTGSQDSVFKQQVAALDKQVKQLEADNLLTRNQIQKLDKTLLDTILFFQRQRVRANRKIQKLQSELNNQIAQNAALSDSLTNYRAQLRYLQDSIGQLVIQLADALEEKYLRQKSHYDDLSSLILNYLTALKDVRDWLPKMSFYFSNRQAQQHIVNALNQYGDSRNKLFENHQNHLLGIQRYWENPQAFNNSKRVLDFIFEDIHDQHMIAGFNVDIMPHLQKFADSGTRKSGPVKKASNRLKSNLDPLIQQLESEVDTLFELLSKEI